MELMGNVPIATTFFQHLPEISVSKGGIATVLRAFKFKFVEIRLHLSLPIQSANFHIYLPYKITFH